MKSVSKLKFKLINVTGCILLWTEFLGIKLDLDFSARLEHKINMKLVNIFVPKEQTHVYAIQESEKVYLFKSHRVQKNCIRVKCRKNMQAKFEIEILKYKIFIINSLILIFS